MNLFGIGLPEILFILFLALLIFGPKDLERTGKALGKGLNKLIRSDTWKVVKDTGRELKNLPNRLMRESGLEDIKQATTNEIKKTTDEISQSIPAGKDE
ncbi:MAG: twin-arginine translocase TatA/TatE family subunit [Chloroflexi bacterium]|nr:twin-arginine translocase TatA/TatE family subunit [Chloroflexota bacterium]